MKTVTSNTHLHSRCVLQHRCKYTRTHASLGWVNFKLCTLLPHSKLSLENCANTRAFKQQKSFLFPLHSHTMLDSQRELNTSGNCNYRAQRCESNRRKNFTQKCQVKINYSNKHGFPVIWWRDLILMFKSRQKKKKTSSGVPV